MMSYLPFEELNPLGTIRRQLADPWVFMTMLSFR